MSQSKFFPFWTDPTLVGLHCKGKQTGSPKKSFLFLINGRKKEFYPYTVRHFLVFLILFLTVVHSFLKQIQGSSYRETREK